MYLNFNADYEDSLEITGLVENYSNNNIIPSKKLINRYVEFSKRVIADQLKSKLTKQTPPVEVFSLDVNELKENYNVVYMDVLAILHESIIFYYELLPEQVRLMKEYPDDIFGTTIKKRYQEYLENKNATFIRVKKDIDDLYDQMSHFETLKEVMKFVDDLNTVLAL